MPGLLSYREDNKKLYVNEGNKWDAIASEKEVSKSYRNAIWVPARDGG